VGQQPLLANPPKPVFGLRWGEKARTWRSESAATTELPEEIHQVFEELGYGCLAAETNIGVVHACHTGDGTRLQIAARGGYPLSSPKVSRPPLR
jgi:hypothetical protein